MISGYNMSSDMLGVPYPCNVIFSQYNEIDNYQNPRQAPSESSITMSTSSNPGSPDSMSMPMSSPASMTLSPQSMENLLGMSIAEEVRNNIIMPGQEPCIVIREQPTEKYRFRYKSEMMGSHGCLLGRNSDKRRKFFPSVELMNFKGTGIIRCSLYTAQPDESLRTLHCHRLLIKMGKDEIDDPHTIPINPVSGYIAVFRGMGIIHTAKKHIADELVRKKRYRLLERPQARNINITSLSQNEEIKIRAEAEEIAKKMNLNIVSLCFEAFVYDDNGVLAPICKPVFSECIYNMKSALTGELKICRIDRHFSKCNGGDEVWMLVEKVGKKNIKVKFYEIDEDDNEVWCDYGKFTELDVHHQYAIVFRTPPYRSLTIEEPVDVLVQLYRPSDGGCSEPLRFTYRPSEKLLEGSRKRARLPSSEFPLVAENGFTLGPTNHFMSNLFDCASSPMLGLGDADTNELRDIDMLSVNSTTIEDILGEKGLESAEFKEFVQNLSFDRYYETYTSDSVDLVTDSAQKTKNPRQATRAVPPMRRVNASTSAPRSGEDGEGTKQTPFSRHLSGDQLLQIVMRRLFYLITSGPTTTMHVAEGIRDLFEKKSDDGDTALHVAVKPEKREFLDKILAIVKESRTIECSSVQMYISNVLDSRNKKLETPLHRSVLYNQPTTVAALLQGGASANLADVNGYTPLHVAVHNLHNECLEQLLNPANYNNSELQVCLNAKSEDGYSPLCLATRKRNIDAVRMLVSAGADVNEKDQLYGRAPIHIAVEEECADVLRFLCSRPDIHVNEPNFDGNTALHLACVVGSLELSKILLQAKADPRIANCNIVEDVEDGAGQEESVDVLTIVKEEPDCHEGCGQTAFDLAADNEQLLEYLRNFELSRTEPDVTEVTIKKEIKDEYDLPQPKVEPPTLAELFDSWTLSEVCAILDRTQGWMRLAQLLDYTFLVASISETQSPTKVLFNYADLHGNVTLERIRSHLQILDENEAVAVIDEMLTRRLLATDNVL